MKKVIKRTLRIISIILTLMIMSLWAYTLNSSKPLDEMTDQIKMYDLTSLTYEDGFDHISYKVLQPKKQIVFIPGGKVDPKSYEYLAVKLALAGYDVTIVKTLFNLAILTPNYAKKFIEDDIDNVIIGHSLGGTVASMVAYQDERISDVIFLASYTIKDLSDKHVLTITAENDQVLDLEKVEASKVLLSDQALFEQIIGGNHAQFGWYGVQKGDGEATIDTLNQQDQVIQLILNFID